MVTRFLLLDSSSLIFRVFDIIFTAFSRKDYRCLRDRLFGKGYQMFVKQDNSSIWLIDRNFLKGYFFVCDPPNMKSKIVLASLWLRRTLYTGLSLASFSFIFNSIVFLFLFLKNFYVCFYFLREKILFFLIFCSLQFVK